MLIVKTKWRKAWKCESYNDSFRFISNALYINKLKITVTSVKTCL